MYWRVHCPVNFLYDLTLKQERIIKEGMNIAPGDLEKVLDEHPAVNNVMVSIKYWVINNKLKYLLFIFLLIN